MLVNEDVDGAVGVITRVASEAKRAERNEVERVCGGEGGVLSASWSLCLFVCGHHVSRTVLNGF